MSIDSMPTLELADGRATITLRRPSEHNRIAPDDVAELLRHFEHIESEPSVRVLVLTGTGDKTFSSGYTIDAIRDTLDNRFERMLDKLECLPLPTICALNGSVYGGATDMALCCDFRIGIEGTRMFMPAAKFGLHYYPGGLRRYVTRLGLTAAKKIMLTAMAIDAEEMLRIGFLTELVGRNDLDEVVLRYVRSIEECDGNVIASMKRDLNQLATATSHLEPQRAAYETSLRSEELAKRLDALG